MIYVKQQFKIIKKYNITWVYYLSFKNYILIKLIIHYLNIYNIIINDGLIIGILIYGKPKNNLYL